MLASDEFFNAFVSFVLVAVDMPSRLNGCDDVCAEIAVLNRERHRHRLNVATALRQDGNGRLAVLGCPVAACSRSSVRLASAHIYLVRLHDLAGTAELAARYV